MGKRTLYIVYSESTDAFRAGFTEDLESRLIDHHRKGSCHFRAGGPWLLLFRKSMEDGEEARKQAQALNRYNQRSWFERLILSAPPP